MLAVNLPSTEKIYIPPSVLYNGHTFDTVGMDSLSSSESEVVGGVNKNNEIGRKTNKKAMNQAAYISRLKASAPLQYAESENKRRQKQTEKRRIQRDAMTDAEREKKRKLNTEQQRAYRNRKKVNYFDMKPAATKNEKPPLINCEAGVATPVLPEQSPRKSVEYLGTNGDKELLENIFSEHAVLTTSTASQFALSIPSVERNITDTDITLYNSETIGHSPTNLLGRTDSVTATSLSVNSTMQSTLSFLKREAYGVVLQCFNEMREEMTTKTVNQLLGRLNNGTAI